MLLIFKLEMLSVFFGAQTTGNLHINAIPDSDNLLSIRNAARQHVILTRSVLAVRFSQNILKL